MQLLMACAWQALLVGAAVAAVRASAALKRWVTQVHAERCGPKDLADPLPRSLAGFWCVRILTRFFEPCNALS